MDANGVLAKVYDGTTGLSTTVVAGPSTSSNSKLSDNAVWSRAYVEASATIRVVLVP